MLYQNCLVLYPMRITEHLNLKTFTLEICISLKLMVSFVYLLVFLIISLTLSFFSPCCADNDDQQNTEESKPLWVALAVTQSYRPKRKVPRSSISIPDLERCLAKASFSASQKSGIYKNTSSPKSITFFFPLILILSSLFIKLRYTCHVLVTKTDQIDLSGTLLSVFSANTHPSLPSKYSCKLFVS